MCEERIKKEERRDEGGIGGQEAAFPSTITLYGERRNEARSHSLSNWKMPPFLFYSAGLLGQFGREKGKKEGQRGGWLREQNTVLNTLFFSFPLVAIKFVQVLKREPPFAARPLK